MAAAPPAVEVFCSYAHEDETWRQKLETHLSLLKRQGIVSLWHDRLITPGTDWAHTINIHLETASIFLLFVSANFFASDYCYGIEMQQALKRHEAGEARVIPLLVRPVDWKDAPFAHLQVLPTDARPLSTWQDEDTALTDVVAGIRRAIEEVPSLAAGTSRFVLTPVWNVPYARNPYFTGHEALLKQLHDHLTTNQSAALTQAQGISGLGGIGKTQIAAEYAYRYRDKYRFILWASAASRETLIADFVTIAGLLNLPEKYGQDQKLTVTAVKRWLVNHDQWLLILDNADDLAMTYDFLPTGGKGHILLTTRAQAAGPATQSFEVEKMEKQEGTLLLLRRAKVLPADAALNQASEENRAKAEEIVVVMDGLPLALDQAGAYIEETGCSISAYLDRYQQRQLSLLGRRGEFGSGHPASLITTLSLCFEQVERQSRAAAELLRFCAFLSADAIPEEVIVAGATQLGSLLQSMATDLILLDEAIAILRHFSLVRRSSNERTLSLHRLVQATLKEGMDEQTRREWSERTVRAINQALPDVTDATVWPQYEHYLPHVFECLSLVDQWNMVFPAASQLLNKLGAYLTEHFGIQILGLRDVPLQHTRIQVDGIDWELSRMGKR
jgi:TIR domain/NB-ARC domain